MEMFGVLFIYVLIAVTAIAAVLFIDYSICELSRRAFVAGLVLALIAAFLIYGVCTADPRDDELDSSRYQRACPHAACGSMAPPPC